jgi:hypothetical protein
MRPAICIFSGPVLAWSQGDRSEPQKLLNPGVVRGDEALAEGNIKPARQTWSLVVTAWFEHVVMRSGFPGAL